MTLDLILLGLVLLFGIMGAHTGGARQIAGLVAVAVAWFVSRQLGPLLGPRMAEALGGTPLLLGTVAASLVLFLVLLVTVRYALTVLLRKLMGASDPDQRGMDHAVGFVLGATKVVLIAYVMLSALVFVEKNVVVAGKHLGLSPKDSVSFVLAHRYNLFELTQFSSVRDLVAVAQGARDPERARRLAEDPAYKALREDPRFKKALANKQLRAALDEGDTLEVLRHNLVLQLLQDPQVVARLSAAAKASQDD